ncbi:hypothetical protein JRQ81_006470 [Phrynocephalus forsythii]|uniref:Ig-like domain-containing protein n=1 Tax=Phrynocephalus forsythii TaxID=171643 RepID=A0A9Q0XGR6_9SAUR|nr:hypothetical protein JRQ81_006470 [Phrynocephalus forsythii]
MNLLPDKACLLPGLIFVVMFLGSTASPLISVIQEPSLINVTEGSTLNMECRDKRNFSGLWSIEWYKNKCLKEGKIQPSSQIVINKNELEKSSYFILKRAAIQDAGIYICCAIDEAHKRFCSNGTHVVISEVTDLMVNQTPGDIEKEEGANIILECQFMPIGNLSYMYVRWYKNRTLLSKRAAEYTIKEDLEEGFTSLTLWKAAESDSKTYTCEVGRADRNLNGSRREFRVAISGVVVDDDGHAGALGSVECFLHADALLLSRGLAPAVGITRPRSDPAALEKGKHDLEENMKAFERHLEAGCVPRRKELRNVKRRLENSLLEARFPSDNLTILHHHLQTLLFRIEPKIFRGLGISSGAFMVSLSLNLCGLIEEVKEVDLAQEPKMQARLSFLSN